LINQQTEKFSRNGSVGGGGDGVDFSTSPNQPRLQLLDFYELSFYDNVNVDLGDLYEDPVVKVTKIIG
jgi:hypothetical protein